MLDFGSGSFFLTPSQLGESPSFRHGIPAETEKTLRIHSCEIIQEACILLRLPQAVAATAQVIFHRFFCKQSFRDFDALHVAASCLWLSMRLEEEDGASSRGRGSLRPRNVVRMFQHVKERREGSQSPNSKVARFEFRPEKLLKLETRILVELGFCCHVEHPHKFLLSYLNCLEASKDLIQESWNLVNDSLRTTLCVCYPSNVVACGIIYAAARRLSVPLPESPPWWVLFDVTKDQISSVCNVLADLYRQPKSRYINLKPVLPRSSLPVAASVQSIEPQQEATSNRAKFADVSCGSNTDDTLPLSGSKILSSCLMNAPGCSFPYDSAALDSRHEPSRFLSSSDSNKRLRDSLSDSGRRYSRYVPDYDETDRRRKSSTRKESSWRYGGRNCDSKHRPRGDYSSCLSFHDYQPLKISRSYGHVRG